MTLEQLRIFVAVAEREHVTQAAQSLGLAQSAVSHAVAALEARHGTRLFDRIGRRIQLTEAGRVFLSEARRVLTQAAAADRALADLAGLRRGTLRVFASQTIAGYWLPRHLTAFHHAYPDVEIRLESGNTARVARAVRTGEADLGLIEGPLTEADLASHTVARDRFLIVTAPSHPWADGRALTTADLASACWVMREAGSGTRAVLEATLKSLGIERPLIALELPSNESVRSAVEAGLGPSALSASVTASALEAGLLVVSGHPLPDRSFVAIWRAHQSLPPVSERFLEGLAGSGGTLSPRAGVRGRQPPAA